MLPRHQLRDGQRGALRSAGQGVIVLATLGTKGPVIPYFQDDSHVFAVFLLRVNPDFGGKKITPPGTGMWHWYVALVCGTGMWHWYVALVCGTGMWHWYVALV